MQNFLSFPTLPVCCCSPGLCASPPGRHLAPVHPSSPASVPVSSSQEAYHQQGSTAQHSAMAQHHLLLHSPDPHTPCLLMPAGVTRMYLRAACYPRDRIPYPAALSNSALFQSRSEKYTKVLWKMVFPVLTAGKSAFNACCPWSVVSKVCHASVTGHSTVSTSPGYEDIPWGWLLVIAFWK